MYSFLWKKLKDNFRERTQPHMVIQLVAWNPNFKCNVYRTLAYVQIYFQTTGQGL